MNAQDLETGLGNFWGTDQWYRHALNRNMLYTDGVHFFAENAGNGAYWFLDIVATELMAFHKREEFMNIVLDSDGHKARIIVDDGNDNALYERVIEWTDCPEGKWQFYLENNVLCLPRER
jgi:hypothetical protein